MSSYTALMTRWGKGADVLIRLTPEDSRALMQKLKDAVTRDTGVNLIFLGMRNAFALTKSDERGKEIKCNAFHETGVRVDTPMKGYNGPWSHVEIAMPIETAAVMQDFLKALEKKQQKPELL